MTDRVLTEAQLEEIEEYLMEIGQLCHIVQDILYPPETSSKEDLSKLLYNIPGVSRETY